MWTVAGMPNRPCPPYLICEGITRSNNNGQGVSFF
jgi:hypothetical protein